jgi:predicted Zn-dependent protease
VLPATRKAKGKGKVSILIHEKEAESALPPGLIVAIAVVGLGALGFAGWRFARTASVEPAADPSLFAMPTQPSAAPSSAAPAAGPGAEDLKEAEKLMAQGKAAEALPLLSRAASAAPSNARIQWLWGQALQATAATDEALLRYAEAARLDPRAHALAYSRALDEAGRSADAAAALEAASSGLVAGPVVDEELGKLYYKAGDYAKAAALLDKAVEARPDDPVLRQTLAFALSKSGDRTRAADLYRGILEVAPGADVSRAQLAELLLEQGKGGEAMALLKEGITRDPELPALRFRLASVAERAGDRREASRQYREYVRLAPNAPDAQEAAERATRLEGAGGKS